MCHHQILIIFQIFYFAFQVKDGTGTTVKPDETRIPIHSINHDEYS
jgi:hypothetical protein